MVFVRRALRRSTNRSNKMRAARLLFWKLSTFSGVRYASGVRVRPEITTSSRRPTRVGFRMYRVAEGVRSTHGQDGAIVLDVRQGQMFNLNFVGSRILELLKIGSTESAIVDQISCEFGVSRDLAENDVREFLQSLEKCHLIEKQESGVAV